MAVSSLYPSTRPILFLEPRKSEVLDSRFTVVRSGSTVARVSKIGLIEVVVGRL